MKHHSAAGEDRVSLVLEQVGRGDGPDGPRWGLDRHRLRLAHAALSNPHATPPPPTPQPQYMIDPEWYADVPTFWVGGQDDPDGAAELEPFVASGVLPLVPQLPWQLRGEAGAFLDQRRGNPFYKHSPGDALYRLVRGGMGGLSDAAAVLRCSLPLPAQASTAIASPPPAATANLSPAPLLTAPCPKPQEDTPALPAAAFASLRAAVLAHPLRWRANGLDADNFGKTTGWVLYFNAQGVELLCASPLFAAVCPFFRHVRLPGANAWVRGRRRRGRAARWLLLLRAPLCAAGDAAAARPTSSVCCRPTPSALSRPSYRPPKVMNVLDSKPQPKALRGKAAITAGEHRVRHGAARARLRAACAPAAPARCRPPPVPPPPGHLNSHPPDPAGRHPGLRHAAQRQVLGDLGPRDRRAVCQGGWVRGGGGGWLAGFWGGWLASFWGGGWLAGFWGGWLAGCLRLL
jgi:hypothetical protein